MNDMLNGETSNTLLIELITQDNIRLKLFIINATLISSTKEISYKKRHSSTMVAVGKKKWWNEINFCQDLGAPP